LDNLNKPKGMHILTSASLVLALLQSLCTAILTISGIRMAIGLGALAASSIYAPILGFHGDEFRNWRSGEPAGARLDRLVAITAVSTMAQARSQQE